MKKPVGWVCCVFFVLIGALFAQSGAGIQEADTSLVNKYKVNFAVPDIPAFSMLGSQPGELLRPSTPEALGVILSEFMSGNSLVIPRSLAVEVAPFMLFKYNNLTLQDYDRNAILYSLRISLGAVRSDSLEAAANLSLGARITLLDRGDLKNDRNYRRQLFDFTGNIAALKDHFQDEFLQDNNYTIQEVLVDSSKRLEMERYIDKRVVEYQQEKMGGRTFSEYLQEMKNRYKQANWNRQKWDMAVGVLGASPDTLAQNIKFRRVSFWTTYGLPVRHWGQILVGGNVSYNSNQQDFFEFSAASRFYGGINEIKGFLETQYQYQDLIQRNQVMVNLGSEVSLKSGIWVLLTAGIEYFSDEANEGSQFTSHFDVRFTLPERWPF